MKNLKLISPSVCISVLLAVTACSESEFTSGNGRSKAKQTSADLEGLLGENVGMDGNIIYVPADVDIEDGKPVDEDADGDGKLDKPVAIGKAGKGLDITLDPIRKTIGGGSSSMMPVDFYFAVDVTGSMQPNINSIKNNIQSFANELASKKYSARLSLITFKDTVESSMNPTSNIGDFINRIGSKNAAGGGDANEAGLAGISEAINKIKETKAPEAYAAIIMITDNPAHMGGNTRDCNISSLVNQFNNLPEDTQKKVKLYGSLGPAGSNCSGYANPKAQMQEILRKSLSMVPVEQRGSESLSYPFQKGTLLDELIPYIERTIPKKDFVCLADSAVLSSAGDSVGT